MGKIFPVFVLLFLFFCAVTIAQPTVGLITHGAKSLDSGYVLFSPMNDTTYLIDKCGKLVHLWPSDQQGGGFSYLLPNGNLLRAGAYTADFGAKGGGTTELQDWNGKILWSYAVKDSLHQQHHDVCMLPNGNVLCLVSEIHYNADAIAMGRDTNDLGQMFLSENIVELKPIGADSAEVVWTWRAWDHLIQDYDSTKINYEEIDEHPELININYPIISNPSGWLHTTNIKFNADLNVILVSVHNVSELWCIDHSTTTAEAASHAGGHFRHGGDLIYRWGNPSAYNRATPSSQKFFGQHTADWVPAGYSNAGKIIVFNNGLQRLDGSYSSVDFFTPMIDSPGVNSAGTGPYLPNNIDWRYTDPVPMSFFCTNTGGAQMLSNGNILICNGVTGEFFEVDSAREKVWDYVQPVDLNGPVTQGKLPQSPTQYRVTFYPYSYSAFNGHVLTSGSPIEYNPQNYQCTLNIDTLSAVNEQQYLPVDNTLFVYPNPASDHLSINASTGVGAVMLYNMLGEKIIESTNATALNIANIPAGLYSLVMVTNGRSAAKMISVVK